MMMPTNGLGCVSSQTIVWSIECLFHFAPFLFVGLVRNFESQTVGYEAQ